MIINLILTYVLKRGDLDENTILEKKKRVSDHILYALIQLSSFLSIFILFVIIGYILYRGIPAFDFSYLVNRTSPIVNKT